jgi:hypothetical protein
MPEINPITTEIWKPVIGYEGFYNVSNLGNVKRIASYRWGRSHALRMPNGNIKPVLNGHGYPIIKLHKKGILAHKILHSVVCAAFIGPKPKGFHTNHKDGNKTNNRLDNLEYCTPRENSKHAMEHGLVATGLRTGVFTHPEGIRRGELNGMSVLKEDSVNEIRNLSNKGWTRVALAKMYGVDRTNISCIVLRKTWKHI